MSRLTKVVALLHKVGRYRGDTTLHVAASKGFSKLCELIIGTKKERITWWDWRTKKERHLSFKLLSTGKNWPLLIFLNFLATPLHCKILCDTMVTLFFTMLSVESISVSFSYLSSVLAIWKRCMLFNALLNPLLANSMLNMAYSKIFVNFFFFFCSLKRLLHSKADVFLSNHYYESDLAWMDLVSHINYFYVTIILST